MKGQIKFKLGNSQIMFESEGKAQDIVKDLAFWGTIRSECGSCSGHNVSLNHRHAKGFDFYGLICNDCGAQAQFGQLKEGNRFYMKHNAKWEKFTKSSDVSSFNKDDEGPF